MNPEHLGTRERCGCCETQPGSLDSELADLSHENIGAFVLVSFLAWSSEGLGETMFSEV